MFYHAYLNNIASEQGARMNAMENASKNAGEIVDKLTLQYNKARQAKITMELCEIISGASAVWTHQRHDDQYHKILINKYQIILMQNIMCKFDTFKKC